MAALNDSIIKPFSFRKISRMMMTTKPQPQAGMWLTSSSAGF